MKIFCIKELWKNDASSNAIFFNFTDLAFLPLFFAYKIFLPLDCWAFRYSFFPSYSSKRSPMHSFLTQTKQ